MAEINIENVVASGTIGTELSLPDICKKLEDAEYESERFPGMIYRLKKPKTATLIFRSGKVVCTGAKSLEDARTAIAIVAKKIEATGVKVIPNPDIIVQNIVATSDLKCNLNLNTIAISLSLEKIEYEPEQFPGLVYRMDDPKVVILIFGSGKIVCTGARNPEDISKAVDYITEELRDAGLLG